MAVYLDVNSVVGYNGKPEIVSDYDAIQNSLYNLFKTQVGSEKFNHEYGCNLEYFLQEPTTAMTARAVFLDLRMAIERWEPRIVFDAQNSFALADTSIPGFNIQIAYTIKLSQRPGVFAFTASKER